MHKKIDYFIYSTYNYNYTVNNKNMLVENSRNNHTIFLKILINGILRNIKYESK